MTSTNGTVNDRTQVASQAFELEVRGSPNVSASLTPDRLSRPTQSPETQHSVPEGDRASPHSDSSTPLSCSPATGSNSPISVTTNPSSISTPSQQNSNNNYNYPPSLPSQDTWASDQPLLSYIPRPSLDWSQHRFLTLVVAISTIAASFIALASLGVQIWQAVSQNSPPPRSDEYQKIKDPAATGPSSVPNGSPLDPRTNSNASTLQIVVRILIALAILALGISLYALSTTLRHARGNATARRASDFAAPAMAASASALTRLHQHTRAHARYAHDVVRSYHVRLQEIGADHWRFWAAPILTVEMLRQRMEEEDWEIATLISREGRGGGDGGGDVEDGMEEAAEEGDDEDTDIGDKVVWESGVDAWAGCDGEVADAEDQSAWEGEISRRETKEEEESGEEDLGPEDFQRANTHVTARTAVELGEEGLKRRFHEIERLRREREAEEYE